MCGVHTRQMPLGLAVVKCVDGLAQATEDVAATVNARPRYTVRNGVVAFPVLWATMAPLGPRNARKGHSRPFCGVGRRNGQPTVGYVATSPNQASGAGFPKWLHQCKCCHFGTRRPGSGTRFCPPTAGNGCPGSPFLPVQHDLLQHAVEGFPALPILHPRVLSGQVFQHLPSFRDLLVDVRTHCGGSANDINSSRS